MKKIIVLVFSLAFAFNLQASSLLTYWNFISSYNLQNGSNLAQRYPGQTSLSKKHLGSACGTMCLLAVDNYYAYKKNSTPNYISYKFLVEAKIIELFSNYTNLNAPYYSYQSVYDMKNMVKNGFRWNTAKIRSGAYSGYNQLVADLNLGRIPIILTKAHSLYGIQHFIAVIYANNSFVIYFDPWVGKIKDMTKTKFLNSWVGSKISFITQP